jgi:formate C-acetyltransferase
MTCLLSVLPLVAGVMSASGDAKRDEIVNEGYHVQPSIARMVRPEKIEDMATYLKWKWQCDLTDPDTGLNHVQLTNALPKVVEAAKPGEDWFVTKARLLEFLLDRTAVGLSRFDCFPAIASWNRWERPMHGVLNVRGREVEKDQVSEEMARAYRHIGRLGGAVYRDYHHSAPDWDEILKLGFSGMKKRIDEHPGDSAFYRAERIAAAAAIRFLARLERFARRELERCGGKTEYGLLEKQIDSLARLQRQPPRTVFDVMQFTFIYFVISEYFDWVQVRTLGNLDRLWWPYYERDVREGVTTEAQFREEFRHFIWQFGSIDNYWGHPFYLGGTAADGSTQYNPLSMIILDVVDREALATPKLQLKMAPNTPDDIWEKALGMISRHRSLVLMGEKGMAQSMKRLGIPDDECRRLVIWGCFEWLPPYGMCTSAGRVNLIKPLEEMLGEVAAGRAEYPDFESLKKEYFRRLSEITDLTVRVVNATEIGMDRINPSVMLSLGVENAVRKGVDALSAGMKYNHSSLSGIGFATLLDSLVAIREMVYEKRKVTLRELAAILEKNWQGHEELRLQMARSRNKWGCGGEPVNSLGREILREYAGNIVGRPNSRGGVFGNYGVNSRSYITAGRVTGATPDGRRAGEEISKNMSPSIGGDAEGFTAVLRNWWSTVDPAQFPCGLVLDAMIHSSSVQGVRGRKALRSAIEAFFDNGGCALNLNIHSVEELKDAQKHPERYENLQIRVAGWNIRWIDIPRIEQDGFIRRLESMPR